MPQQGQAVPDFFPAETPDFFPVTPQNLQSIATQPVPGTERIGLPGMPGSSRIPGFPQINVSPVSMSGTDRPESFVGMLRRAGEVAGEDLSPRNMVNALYSLSAPNIARQMFQHFTGRPETGPNPEETLKGLAQGALQTTAPGIVYQQAIGKPPEEIVGHAAAAMVPMMGIEGSAQPLTPERVAARNLEMRANALSAAGRVPYETATQGIQAIREAAAAQGVKPESLTGRTAYQQAPKIVNHAININESRVA